MATALEVLQASPLIIRLPEAIRLTDDQFFEFCRLNDDLQLERTAEGEIVIMAPAGGESSYRSVNLAAQLFAWAEKDGTGVAFDSSACFILPNRATLSPDAAWVGRTRLARLSPEHKTKFLPLCPDFVAEILSPSDSLVRLREKMHECVQNGAQLGWLIDPERRQVYIYGPGSAPDRLDEPQTLSDPLLPGFVVDLRKIWAPGL